MSPSATAEPSPTRLTIAGVEANRSRTALPTHIVAASHADMFKTPANLEKPKAKRWDDYFSLETRSRKQNALKAIAPLMKTPGIISLAGGLPSSTLFPFEEVSIASPAAPNFTELHKQSTTMHSVADGSGTLDLPAALNYAQSYGCPPLVRFISEHTQIVHDPPYSDWNVSCTIGSTSSWDITMRMFNERGDSILYEEFSFSSARESAIPLGFKPVGVKMDEEGPLPEALDEIMTNWDEAARGSRKPRMFYTIPTGHNPTGITHSPERRKAIYQVCQKHSLLLVEDEPYYFLQMQKYKGGGVSENKAFASHDEFIASLVPSYLSIDVDGRVIRLDSFSKILAPGTRIGWITASDQIIERFAKHSESSNQSPSGFSQTVVYELLEQEWGHAGFFDWLLHMQKAYTERRDVLTHACEKYLPTEVASWVVPQAGMFEWIKVDWKKHPAAKEGKSNAEVEAQIFKAAVEAGALVALGSWFQTDRNASEDGMYFRVTFASAPHEKIEEAIHRLGTALKKQFQLA